MIRIENIKKSYFKAGKEIKAIDDISISFREHEFVSILGPSGCGKTTLLNVLGALDKCDSGKIYVNGRDTNTFSNKDWDSYRNNDIGFVFQNYYLIPHLNVFDNVGITLQLSNEHNKEENKEKITNALKRVGLEGLERSYPNQLSGGQCQRVAIARALINNPTVIFADEPTGALDSKSSVAIMDLLKELSKEHLIIMVTHNAQQAEQYSDRIINLLDGHVENDTNPYDDVAEDDHESIKRVHMSFRTGLKLCLKNMWSKKWRHVMTTIASAVGIASTGIILSMRTGLGVYVKDVQKNALGDYPLIVRSVLKTSSVAKEENEDYVKYPDTDYVNVEYSDKLYSDVNRMSDEFLSYLDALDPNSYTAVRRNQNVLFRMVVKTGSGEAVNYKRISNSYFSELCDNTDFLLSQYDVLQGTMPTNKNEFALVIDSYNNLSYDALSGIGYDLSGDTKVSFNDILNAEYNFIDNNHYYYSSTNKQGNKYYAVKGSSYDITNFNASSLSCKISCILRLKENAVSSLFSSGVLYTREFSNYVINSARESDVYKYQMEKGNDLDVLSYAGNDLKGYENDNGVTYSDEYLLNQQKYRIGGIGVCTYVYYYTSDFASRSLITKYVKAYKMPSSSNVSITVRDYIESVTSEFSGLVNVFTNILLVVSVVSLFVSAIMVAIISYISIMERKKEIGLLRSLGARKKDVMVMFLSENAIGGVLAGVVGILAALALCKPVSKVVVDLVAMYSSGVMGTTKLNLAQFNWWIAPLLIVISILVTVLASLMPIIYGCKKPPVESLRSE